VTERQTASRLRSPEAQAELDLTLLRVSRKNTPATLVVQVAASASMVWMAQPASRGWYVWWLGVVLLVCAARIVVDRALMRSLAQEPPPPLLPWRLAHSAGLLISGGLWALLAWLRLPVEAEQSRFVILIVLSALAGGAIGVLAPLRFTGPAYVTLLLAPACASLILQGASSTILGVLGLVFVGVMITGHRNNHALLVRSIELGRENLGLVETLQVRNDEIERVNQSLEQRVAERTEALEALTVEAQAADRAKSEFLATISHEIRTPLNGVLGMAQIMSRGPLEAPQRERLSVIHDSAKTLLGVVNDVLDISKIEAGEMVIDPAEFRLDAFALGIERLYGVLAEDKGLAFSLTLTDPEPGWRLGDEVRLRQVLSNLISNALKFTETGGIAVEIIAGDPSVAFMVRDTGAGVRPQDQSSIFDKFVQADGSNTRRASGTGLGLAICRELATLMGGEISLESAGGSGSCFTLTVPLPRVRPGLAAPSAPASAPPAGRRILVVDDNPTNRLVMQSMLQEFGLDCVMAGDGLEAVAAWEAGDFDAILMDIRMPGLDGLDATRTIRRREAAEGRPRTPIIAVTASVLSHETGAYLAAGMDDVVAKPIDTHLLLDALSRQLTTLEDV
jgi:signal transduction histidine kinase/ActR/RegA family two-component response regulator